MTDTQSDVHRQSIHIEASPDAVFELFLTPEQMGRWMGTSHELDPRPGGRLVVDVTNGNVAEGEFVELDRPSRIVFTWGWVDHPTLPPRSSMIEITFAPDDGGTLVELKHSKLPPDLVESHGEGWSHYLERLMRAAGGDDPGPDPWAQNGPPDNPEHEGVNQ